MCLYGVADRSGLSLEIVSTTAAGKLFGFGKSAEPRHRSGAHEWPDDKWRKRPLPAVRQAPPLRTMLALVAAVLGASGVAGASMSIAKWLVIIFVVLAILTFVL